MGSVKSISFVKLTLTEINEGKDRLNIYTSQDGVTYEGIYSPSLDILRDMTVGEETSVPVGRRARYVALRFDPIYGQIQSTLTITQFDVIGEV